jgi:hypothetical protein
MSCPRVHHAPDCVPCPSMSASRASGVHGPQPLPRPDVGSPRGSCVPHGARPTAHVAGGTPADSGMTPPQALHGHGRGSHSLRRSLVGLDPDPRLGSEMRQLTLIQGPCSVGCRVSRASSVPPPSSSQGSTPVRNASRDHAPARLLWWARTDLDSGDSLRGHCTLPDSGDRPPDPVSETPS